MSDEWVRLHTGWSANQASGDDVGWALWQPQYKGHPWPNEDMRRDFTYYVCDDLATGGRALVAQARVLAVLPFTEATSLAEAYRMVTDELGGGLQLSYPDWQANPYNQSKATSSWPQKIAAWRITTARIAPCRLPELRHFPHTGWIRIESSRISN